MGERLPDEGVQLTPAEAYDALVALAYYCRTLGRDDEDANQLWGKLSDWYRS